MKWTAESAARSHYELSYGLIGAKAISYDGDSGIVYPEKCQCGSSKRLMNFAESDFRKIARCGTCESPWPCRVVVDPQRIPSTAPHRYTLADMIVDLTRVMIEAKRLHLWGFRTFYLFHGERVGGERFVAACAQELWPRAGVVWNRPTVRTLRREGKAALETALDARQLLYRPTAHLARPEDSVINDIQTNDDAIV